MRLAYYRVSGPDQSVEAQRHAMGGGFDREFDDGSVSGGILAAERPEFAKLLDQARPGDVLHVFAVDRLGRDALDIQTNARLLLDRGVGIYIHGLGNLVGDAGKLILAVLSQIAEIERQRIVTRTAAGRAAAKASLKATGRTHRGKASLGRGPKLDPSTVCAWRAEHKASITTTARHFKLSPMTVKRYWRLWRRAPGAAMRARGHK
jgi:putative DNA-invertase from lambdoid prophage Rac